MGEAWPDSSRENMQPLTALVLYKAPDGWQFAIYAGGVMDGRLKDVPTDASVAAAKSALVRLVEEGYGRAVHVEWKVTDTDWWATDASFVG